MDLKRLRLGELVSGAAALGLLIVLFGDWNRDAGPRVENGWQSLGVVMLLLVLIAVGLAFAMIFTTVNQRPAAIPIGATVLMAGAGIVVTLVLAIRIVFLDDSLGAAYLGLALMALITAGAWRAMGDERTTASYSAAPDLPRRPAPPAQA